MRAGLKLFFWFRNSVILIIILHTFLCLIIPIHSLKCNLTKCFCFLLNNNVAILLQYKILQFNCNIIIIQMYIMSYRIVLQQQQQYVIVVVVYRDQSLNINVGNTYQNYQTFFFSIQNFLFFFVKSFFFRSCYSLLFFVGRSTRVSFCCWFFFLFRFFFWEFLLVLVFEGLR